MYNSTNFYFFFQTKIKRGNHISKQWKGKTIEVLKNKVTYLPVIARDSFASTCQYSSKNECT